MGPSVSACWESAGEGPPETSPAEGPGATGIQTGGQPQAQAGIPFQGSQAQSLPTVLPARVQTHSPPSEGMHCNTQHSCTSFFNSPPPPSLPPRPTDRAQMSLSIPFGPWGESEHQQPAPSGWASPDHGESPSCRHSQAIPHTVAHLSVESPCASTTPRSLRLHCTATGLAHLGLLGAETRQ